MEKVNIAIDMEKITKSVLLSLIVKVVLLLLALIFTVSALGVFANVDTMYKNDLPFNDHSYCILFVTTNKLAGSNESCQFSIAGEAIAAVLILIALAFTVIAPFISKLHIKHM